MRRRLLYFIQDSASKAIKIGTSHDVTTRLQTMQTGNPSLLNVLGTVPAYEGTETIWHQDFKEFKIRGEWYLPVQKLLDAIEATCKEPL